MVYLLIILILSSSISIIPVSSEQPSRREFIPIEPPGFKQPGQDVKPMIPPLMSEALSLPNPPLPSQSNTAAASSVPSTNPRRVEESPTTTATSNHLRPLQASHSAPSGRSRLEPLVQLPVSSAQSLPNPPLPSQSNTAAGSTASSTSHIHQSQPITTSNHLHPLRASHGRTSHRHTAACPLCPPLSIVPQQLPIQEPADPLNLPWYHQNPLLAIEGDHNRIPPNEFHRMDHLSMGVMTYFLSGGLRNTASWAQRPSLSTSIHIQCFLNQIAFSLLALAHFVFPRTHPVWAFGMDRLSVFLVVVSGYLSNMPMYDPQFAIIMLLVAFVYMVARYRS